MAGIKDSYAPGSHNYSSRKPLHGIVSGGEYMQVCDNLELEFHSWFPQPGGAASDVMARGQYHIGFAGDSRTDRLERRHAIYVEVIHRAGELPFVKFDGDWPAGLALKWKSKIVVSAITTYLNDSGCNRFPLPELESLLQDLTIVRKSS